MYPHTITIINVINERGRLTYYSKIITGVHYQDKQTVRTGSKEHFSDNQGYVQIPKSIGGYVTPSQYEELLDKTNNWTLKENDFIVKGSHTENDPKIMDGVRTIKSIEDIDYGITIPHHFGVDLK